MVWLCDMVRSSNEYGVERTCDWEEIKGVTEMQVVGWSGEGYQGGGTAKSRRGVRQN